MNEHLSRLIERELIVRLQNEEDSRSYGLELTTRGRELLATLLNQKKEFYEKVQQILDDQEHETMTFLSRKLSERLKKEDNQCQ